jgi:hypothetical protein
LNPLVSSELSLQYLLLSELPPVSSFIVNETRFIVLEPYDFPYPHGSLKYIKIINSTHIEMIEEELKKGNAKQNILLCYFTNLIMKPKDKSRQTDKDIEDLLKENFIGFLNGHSHPEPSFNSWHHGTSVEITGSYLSSVSKYGMMTIDNGRFNYHSVDLIKEYHVLLTYPISDSVSGRIYCDNEFNIRLLSFDESRTRIFTVSGSVEGILKFNRIVKTGVLLYTLECRLDNGHHSINITENENVLFEIEFSIGVQSNKISEYQYLEFDPSGVWPAVILSIVFFSLIFLLWIIFVFFRCCDYCDYYNSYCFFDIIKSFHKKNMNLLLKLPLKFLNVIIILIIVSVVVMIKVDDKYLLLFFHLY